jgi:hypothetical protein
MPDSDGNLIPSDVESYTSGRLGASDPETLRLLNTALAVLRNYCGWYVSPTITETMILDGNDRHDMWLPTLNVVTINSITVFDSNLDATVDIDITDPTQFAMSSREPGIIYRGGCGRWTWGHGNVTVNLTHGFAEAYDWQAAALELTDRMSASIGNVMGNSGPMTSKKVDDVTYQWASPSEVKKGSPAGDLFGAIDHTLINQYRLIGFA